MALRNDRWLVLGGLTLASTLAAAQLMNPAAPPQAGPLKGEAAQANERNGLMSLNATEEAVWVTVFNRGQPAGSECFRPQHGKLWVFKEAQPALSIQAQAAPDCKPPAGPPSGGCFARLDVRPDTKVVELRGEARRCEWRPMQAQQALKAAGPRGIFITRNNFPSNSMWVTVYESGIFGRTIVETGCVGPRQTGSFARPRRREGGYPLGDKHYIRAEVTKGANCASSVICDTTVGAVPSLGGQTLELQTGCYWDTVNAPRK